MRITTAQFWMLRIWKDARGQDFLDSALIAAFVATAYAAITPTIAPLVTSLLSKVSDALVKAGG